MHKPLTKDEAVALYKKATKAIKYDGLSEGSTVVRFESGSKLVQVNTFASGRKEFFTDSRGNYIVNLFEDLYNEENGAEWLIK